MHYRSLLRLDVLLAALESFLIFAFSYINMSTDRELDTPSLTAVSEKDDSQRSSVITSADQQCPIGNDARDAKVRSRSDQES